jgi:two-component system, cell cycle sensor histidine kinase and response regulator CckA
VKTNQPADATELRCHAEERLKGQRTEERGQKTELETARLVHELRVHQVELEMQNEELQQMRARAGALTARYCDLYDFAPTGYLTLDREGAIRQVNLAGARLLGIERSQLVNRRLGLFVAEGDRRAFSDFLERVFASEAKESCEVTLPQAGQHPLYVRIEGTRSANGQECLAVLVDLTERKTAEERIRAQARLLDLAQDAIAVLDMNGGVQYWNKGCERLTGWTAAEAAGWPMDELLQPDRAVAERAVQVLLEAGHWSGEIVVTTKDRRRVTLMSRWTLVRDEQGQPRSVLTISTDLTEYKKLEEQFLRAQRLESVGRLAGGIAHDLNNILAPILMGASLLEEGLPLAEARPLIDTIARSAQRGADIVKQLLTFARGTDGQKAPLSPSRLIKDMARIVQETFPKSIACRTEFPKGLWTVAADPTQLHQVLLNLCVNARDAMPEGGTLTLAAENVMLGDRYASMSPEAKAGPYVVLEVSDTGTGMSQEIKDKIFEPFFTTKGLETGTGLGLATVHGIVKNHGGFIQVESQAGRGSRFRVYLPALPSAIAPAAATPARELPRGQGQLVLVVDDEPSVRDITRQILEKSGYRVLTANEGTAAIALYTQRQAEIQVVLIDRMMPIMDGPATVRVLRGMNPQVKIIAASGAVSKVKLAEIADLSVQAYLQKPFTSQNLLVTLDQVLRGEQTHQQPGV